MSSFTSPLIVSPMADGRKWRLERPFTFHIGSQYSLNYIQVPKHFVTDFASIPWFFWTFLPYWGKYGKAAVIHDYIYQTHCRTREEADDIFYEAMLVSGTKHWKAMVMYASVRMWGGLAWGKKRTGNHSR